MQRVRELSHNARRVQNAHASRWALSINGMGMQEAQRVRRIGQQVIRLSSTKVSAGIPAVFVRCAARSWDTVSTVAAAALPPAVITFIAGSVLMSRGWSRRAEGSVVVACLAAGANRGDGGAWGVAAAFHRTHRGCLRAPSVHKLDVLGSGLAFARVSA